MYEDITYETLLNRILNRIPSNLDTRESSFLYNATSAVAAEIAGVYIAIDNIRNITFFDTADREGKYQRCKERGIDTTQFDATKAICVLKVLPQTLRVPIGTRFNYNDLNFAITQKKSDGEYYVECETAGSFGNITGSVDPIQYLEGLVSSEIISIFKYGEDEASESEINKVFYESLNSQAFGGNKADYKQKIKAIEGVGGVKVYSASEWNGGGTVRVVFNTSSYTSPSEDFVDSVQTIIDPVQNQGAGIGLAPIGHIVTVEGTTDEVLNISFDVSLHDGYVWDDVSTSVESAIDAYFLELNEGWENEDNIIVRISQIETRVLSVTGVIDVNNTKIAGNETDNEYVDANYTIPKDNIAVRGDIEHGSIQTS